MTTVLVILIFAAALVGFAIGYKANPRKVEAFVKAHIVDDAPEAHEDHADTRYESPIAREARKASEVGRLRDEEIEAVRYLIAHNGKQTGEVCVNCPLSEFSDFDSCDCLSTGHGCLKQARAWLASHNLHEADLEGVPS
jgi:hypothetical protein